MEVWVVHSLLGFLKEGVETPFGPRMFLQMEEPAAHPQLSLFLLCRLAGEHPGAEAQGRRDEEYSGPCPPPRGGRHRCGHLLPLLLHPHPPFGPEVREPPLGLVPG